MGYTPVISGLLVNDYIGQSLGHRLLCVIYTAIPSICVVPIGLAVPCPTPPLFHQQPVSAEEREKQQQPEIVQEENKQLQIRILMFSVAKASYESQHACQNWSAFGFLDRKERKGNIVLSKACFQGTNIKRMHVGV